MIEFREWPKIPRLNRDITITEKIDGTNGGIGIVAENDVDRLEGNATVTDSGFVVYAQSRKRIITPSQDNHGFAKWVWANATALTEILGEGLHFGEWWGSGIQRGYGKQNGQKFFSLFNTKRWNDIDAAEIPGLTVVPTLYEGPFDEQVERSVWADFEPSPWRWALHRLADEGSLAAPGYNDPEGIVVYHSAGNMCFKITLKNDETPKDVFLKAFGSDADVVFADYAATQAVNDAINRRD